MPTNKATPDNIGPSKESRQVLIEDALNEAGITGEQFDMAVSSVLRSFKTPKSVTGFYLTRIEVPVLSGSTDEQIAEALEIARVAKEIDGVLQSWVWTA